ncbi:MAG: DUF1974 domain-containing protein, partial [Gammaproteobacteria bacterium]|nr:DUF1974 domain-containing protein [Gammaproteobacteria bacterium]
AQEQLHGFLRNFPNRPVAFLLRCIIFPRGRTYSAPADDLAHKLVALITETGEARERLSGQAYKALEPSNPLGLLQEALALSEKHRPMEQKLKQARREGLIQAEYFGHQIDEAERAEIISAKEAAELRDYHAKVQYLLSVDDFAPEALRRQTGDGEASATSPPAGTAPRKARRKRAKKTPRSKVGGEKTAD